MAVVVGVSGPLRARLCADAASDGPPAAPRDHRRDDVDAVLGAQSLAVRQRQLGVVPRRRISTVHRPTLLRPATDADDCRRVTAAAVVQLRPTVQPPSRLRQLRVRRPPAVPTRTAAAQLSGVAAGVSRRRLRSCQSTGALRPVRLSSWQQRLRSAAGRAALLADGLATSSRQGRAASVVVVGG